MIEAAVGGPHGKSVVADSGDSFEEGTLVLVRLACIVWVCVYVCVCVRTLLSASTAALAAATSAPAASSFCSSASFSWCTHR